MMIRTYDSDYIVIRHVQSSSSKDIYICRRNNEQNGREYTVICIKDIAVCQQLLKFFSEKVETKKFTDFVEYFTFEGKLHIVFFNSRLMTLGEKLRIQVCPFAERLEIAQKILERIIYLSMPYAFIADALVPEHITVSDTLDVRFNYEMSNFDRMDSYTLKEAGHNIADVLRFLFQEELEKMSCPEIDELLQWLESDGYQSYLDILYKFNEYYTLLKDKPEEEVAVPKTKLFKLWEKLKIVFGWLKKLLMAALLVAVVIYLAYSIVDFINPQSKGSINPVDSFNAIGTQQILDADGIDE